MFITLSIHYAWEKTHKLTPVFYTVNSVIKPKHMEWNQVT